ncbi:MAG: type I methionyl aminopeptidase [Anaerolineae bacterium]
MTIASDRDVEALQTVGRIVGLTIQTMQQALRPGITTAELDAVGAEFLAAQGARSAPQLVYSFPGATCISVNEETVHGVPDGRVIHPGDLVTIDVTAELDGYIADAAITAPLPPASRVGRRLCRCAESALRKALRAARAGRPLNSIGRAVETEVRRWGFTVIPQLNGHGLGKTIHEEPTVPNFYHRRFSQPLSEGLVIAIEPIIAAGNSKIITGADGWTISTADGSLSAHFEHTVVITKGSPIVVTQVVT